MSQLRKSEVEQGSKACDGEEVERLHDVVPSLVVHVSLFKQAVDGEEGNDCTRDERRHVARCAYEVERIFKHSPKSFLWKLRDFTDIGMPLLCLFYGTLSGVVFGLKLARSMATGS